MDAVSRQPEAGVGLVTLRSCGGAGAVAVKCFWIMERENTPQHPVEDVTPDGFIELIINIGAPYVLETEGARDREMPRAILVGPQSKPLTFRCEAPTDLIPKGRRPPNPRLREAVGLGRAAPPVATAPTRPRGRPPRAPRRRPRAPVGRPAQCRRARCA